MEFLIILGLILLNGIFSMSEIAVVSARKSRLEIDANKGSSGARTALKLAENPDRFLSTIQIGITLIGILTGLFSGDMLAVYVTDWIERIGILAPYAPAIAKGLIVVVVTYLTLILGELVPKRIGLGASGTVSKIVSRPMDFLSKLALPFVWVLSKSTEMVVRLIGFNRSEQDSVTEEEIKAIIAQGTEGGEIRPVERDIVDRVFSLGDRDIASLMTPRGDIVYIDVTQSEEQIRLMIKNNVFNVYPVCRGGLDDIIGVVTLKDLFAHADDENFRRQEIIRPAEYIPENMGVYNALELLKQSSVKCGIVIDEFGSVEGIVTLKDMIKGLLGNMPEAGEEDMIIQRQDGSYFVDGQCPFYDFLEYFDIENLYTDYNYNTLGGLIFGILQHVPRTGERFCWLSFEMEIADMDGARIDKVVVRKNGPCD